MQWSYDTIPANDPSSDPKQPREPVLYHCPSSSERSKPTRCLVEASGINTQFSSEHMILHPPEHVNRVQYIYYSLSSSPSVLE